MTDLTSASTPPAGRSPELAGAPPDADQRINSPGRTQPVAGGSGWQWDALVLIVLVTGPLILFRDGLLHDSLFYERDTYVFYYPLLEWVVEQWRQGGFPLWTPLIFGGYAIFADGELGMLYPLNWLLFLTLPIPLAFEVRRIVHFVIAAVGMYGFVRLVGVGRAGAALAGLTFSLGSFLVVQMHHENIVLTAVWLPLILMLVELGLRRAGVRRHQWLVAAGLLFGMAMLGLHVQVVAMTTVVIGMFTTLRLVLGPVPGSLWERLLLIAWAPAVVVGLGAWISAVQWVPLFELGRMTYRGAGLTYDSASAYAQTIQNLPTVVLPYLFRRPDGERWWTLWDPWETHLYMGVLPLALAVFAVLAVRRRTVLFFTLVAIVGLLISLADESPIKLFRALWQLPGFSSIRAPGRFSFLVVFGVAGLAGLGLDAWTRRDRPRQPPLWLGIGTVLVGAGVAAGLWGLRARLLLDMGRGEEWVMVRYLSVRHGLLDSNAQRLLQDLVTSLDPLATKNACQILLLLAVGTLFLAWRWRNGWWRCWTAAALGLTMLDLLIFGSDFHPQAPTASVLQLPPVADFLARAARGERISASSTLKPLEPNRLVRIGVHDVAGYSSLPSQRQFDYWSSVNRQENELLDLWGIRYVVSPPVPPDVLLVEGTAYRPFGRLMAGPAGNPTGRAHFRVEPTLTGEIRVLSSIGHSVEIPQGEAVTLVTIRATDGRVERLTLLAGVHVAEHAYSRPGLGALIQHSNPPVAATVPELDPVGNPEAVNVYLSRFEIDPPMEVESVWVQHVANKGTSHLYSVGLVDPSNGRVRSLLSSDRAEYREVYRDAEAIVLENAGAYPRAFVVPEAMARRSRTEPPALETLALEPFDAHQTVILEDGPFDGLSLVETPAGDLGEIRPPKAAEVEDLSPQGVRVRVDDPAGGYLVLTDLYHRGWKATVDGQAATVYLADFMFRAVPVPAGRHVVEFTFEPFSVRFGAALSLGALVFAAAVLLLLPHVVGRVRRVDGEG